MILKRPGTLKGSDKSLKMLKHLKEFVWELKDEIARFNYINEIIMKIPGGVGQKIRRYIIPRYFQSCGRNITIFENVRFRSLHRMVIGDNVDLGVDNFFQAGGGITIGNDVIFGPGVKIWSINHRVERTDIPIREQGYSRESVTIDDGVWLGANVFVMPGVHITQGCVVSAGSVVGKKKYPPYSIISGNPARVIGNRKT